MIEEKEFDKTDLSKLIDNVTKDDIPTNEFTIEDKDPMVILGKLNDIIAKLTAIRDLVDNSDTNSLEALNKAIEALSNSQKAIEDSLIALETANTSIESANTALGTANNSKIESAKALENSQNALNNVNDALTKANKAITDSSTALTNSNDALINANKAITDSSTALTNSNEALTKANKSITDSDTAITDSATALEKSIKAITDSATALEKSEEALDKVITGLGTIIYNSNGTKLSSASFVGSDTIDIDNSIINRFVFKLNNDYIVKINSAVDDIIFINRKIDTINTTISNHSSSITNIKNNLNTIGKDIEDINIEINGINNKLDNLINNVIPDIYNNLTNKYSPIKLPDKIKDAGGDVSVQFGYSNKAGNDYNFGTTSNKSNYVAMWGGNLNIGYKIGYASTGGNNYLRFGDYQIIFFNETGTKGSTKRINYPIPFLSGTKPIVLRTLDSTGTASTEVKDIAGWSTESIDNTGFTIYTPNISGATNNQFIAIGKWR